MAVINGYHVDVKLEKHWQRHNLHDVKKRNSDRVYITDGRERVGKSLWTIQQACVIEPALLENPEKLCERICFTPEEFNSAVRNIKNGVIIFDEAFRGLSSRAAMSKVNKKIVQTLMEMGQNNNIVFIVLPSIFLLDVYPAMLRSDALFHIAEDKNTRMRAFYGYNREDKNKTYQIGLRKGWGYPIKSLFRGRFANKFPGGKEFEDAYLAKKAAAFRKMLSNEGEKDELIEIAKRMRNEQGKEWKEIGKTVGLSAEAIRRRIFRANNHITLY